MPELSEVLLSRGREAKRTPCHHQPPHTQVSEREINTLLSTEGINWTWLPHQPCCSPGQRYPQGAGAGLAQQSAQTACGDLGQNHEQNYVNRVLRWSSTVPGSAKCSAVIALTRSAPSQAQQYQRWGRTSVCSWRPELTQSEL